MQMSTPKPEVRDTRDHEILALKRQLKLLETALTAYKHCRHGMPDCNCTKEARAALCP